MFATQPTHLHSTNLSPKETLRAHVDQLSLTQQREFVAAALGLIATRNMMDEVEETVSRSQPQTSSNHIIH